MKGGFVPILGCSLAALRMPNLKIILFLSRSCLISTNSGHDLRVNQ